MTSKNLILVLILTLCCGNLYSSPVSELKGKQIIFIEREQYPGEHHNTATMFQKGEINEKKFKGGSAMKIFDVNTKKITTIFDLPEGIVRDPELSYDGKKVIFSARKNADDAYHIYEINIDGTNIKQLTFASGVSDIDPLYLPNDDIVFSSTRQPKYCMCARHIMANLFKMHSDGSNITQIGVSTLFEGHSTMLPDGRILYDRWEYVDRNFGDAQGLWTVNPDGTKHSIYYGNNMRSPGGVIDARAIPGTDLVACIFGNCHERPWGALAVLDRKLGVDGEQSVKYIFPAESRALIDKGNWDAFLKLDVWYEDPYPLNEKLILVSRTKFAEMARNKVQKSLSCIYLVNTETGSEEIIIEGAKSLFDPIVVQPREREHIIPENRNYKDKTGVFYVQNVYEGTHMKGVEKGSAKYLRLVESPEKRNWTRGHWQGQGAQAPGMNWHSFENKIVWGEFPIEADGSVHFEAPAGKHLYFQLLDKDKKMIQSMRSGVSVMPGEVNGCIGCHEDRLTVPAPSAAVAKALKKSAHKPNGWLGEKPKKFSFMEMVQPILDKKCVSCHDWDINDREKLVLSGDKNPYFNAAYINLHYYKHIKVVGGGPAAIQQAYSWGSHPSKLTKLIEKGHKGVELTTREKEIIYTWLDLNGVYYPVYESAFNNTPGGRSPLDFDEIAQLQELTGVDFSKLRSASRKMQAQVSFERPELSPCLDAIRADKEKYKQALALIKLGAKRLKETPRGDIEKDLVACEQHRLQLLKYAERMEGEDQNTWNINTKTKRYDTK